MKKKSNTRADNPHRLFLEGIPEAAAILASGGTILHANKALSKLLGKPLARIIGAPLGDFVDAAHRKSFDAMLKSKRASGSRTEVVLDAPRGAAVPVLLSSRPMPTNDGGRTFLIVTDLRGTREWHTERREAERAALAERLRLFEVLETVPVYVVLLSPDYHVPFANKFFRDRFGDSRGKRCFEYLFQRTEPCGNCESYKVMRTGKRHHWEWTGPDGRTYDIHDFPFRDWDGSPLVMEMGIDVTEQKRAEEQLARHRDHLEDMVKERTARLTEIAMQRQLALDAADMGWWHYDPITRVSWWDDRYKEIFGVKEDSRPNEEILARLHPEDLPGVWAEVEAALDPADPRAYSAEYRIMMPDGSMKWIEAHGIASFEGEGKNRRATSLVGTVADITDRKRAEKELRDSQERFRILAEQTPVHIAVARIPEGTIMYANRGFEELYGYTPGELLGGRTLDLYADQAERDTVLGELRRKGSLHDREVRSRRKDGSEIWISISVSRAVYEGVEAYIISSLDLTDRKRLLEELRKKTIELEALFNNSNAGLVLFDAKPPYRVIAHNRYYQELFAEPYRTKGMKGLNVYDYAPAVEAQGCIAVFEEVLRTKKSVDLTDFPYDSNPPATSWFNWHLSPVIHDGEVTALASMSINVTARHEAEQSLRESEERYQRLVKFAPIPLCFVNEKGELSYFNDRFTETFGYTHEDVPTLEEWWRRAYPDEDYRRRVVETWESAVRRASETKADIEPIEYKVTCKDGTVRVIVISGIVAADGTLATFMDITARKAAEREREHLASFPNLNPNPVMEFDSGGKAIFVNPAARKALKEMDAEDRPEVFLPAQVGAIMSDLEAENGKRYVKELKTGNTWYLISAFAATGHGSVRLYSADITERKKTEENLNRALARLALAQQSAGAGVWEWDMTTDTLEWSPELFRLFGLDPARERATFETWRRIMHPDDRAAAEERVRKAVQDHARLENEYRVSLPSGEFIWISASGHTLYDTDGRPQRMSGICLDITVRKRAEEALRETGEFLENLFSYANAPIICWDAKFKITRFNPAFEHLTSYKHEEVLGKNLSMLFPRDTREASLEKIRRTLSGEHWEVVEIPILRKDGEIRVALWNSANVYAQDGRTIMATIAQGQDITQRKQAEERLRRSNENLEQFAYVASHDLQEPLRIITSYSQLLERRYKSKIDRDADDFIEFIVNAAGRMQKLITDLLDYSHMGSEDLRADRVDSNEIIRKVMAALASTIEASKANVTHDPLPVLMVTEIGFTQLLQNLIGNALKFRGLDSPDIRVAARRDDGGWVFSVSDNGIGIEPQYREKIFQIFQRLHPRNDYPGTGIGLSICKKIVENWGGRIWVESEYGKGATFHFTVPEERRRDGQ